MSAAARPRSGLWRFISDDGALIRAAFFVMLAGTLAVLWIDFRELSALDETGVAGPVLPDNPLLPAFDPFGPDLPLGPQVTTDRALLEGPLTARLAGGGVLELTGTIDAGAADRVKAEIETYAEYVKTVALDSPGGSVIDALAIGKLIAAEGLATSVAPGALCASSCPLILASGRERLATPQSAIGIHQMFAVAKVGDVPATRGAAEAMSDAQETTAAITRHLIESGVDPALWLHALETPPNRLYFLSPKELTEYRLVTAMADAGDGA